VQEDIISHIDEFKPSEKESPIPGLEMIKEETFITRYKTNVFVDNSQLKGAPVVFERNPTYYNLFGRIEYKAHLGMMITDFSMIKSGAVHRANGGFLVLETLELLLNYFSWDALKRTLRSEKAEIENIGEQFRTFPAASLKPEPIPINVKVILIGNYYLYHLLYHLDDDFRKMFKIRADFDVNMPRTLEQEKNYASFITAKCKEDNLLPFSSSACASVVEYGSWLAEDQDKLSTRFIDISDIINESSHWAAAEGSSVVDKQHVYRAIGEKTYRSNMIEEKILELIKSGVILIDVDGSTVGQVNGISIFDMGDYTFGKPSRITARTYSGQAGIVNIEREVKLSGPIHNKGVMILSSYLAGRFAQDKTLNLSASIAFEQVYEEIEGDSASSAELYALVSSLAEIPIRQDIAVTGSVNQKGQIQPVGGINRKIEGFFDICRIKGFTANQGVIIPKQNVRHLMLRQDVVGAVAQKKFHIYAIEDVEEGIEILMQKPTGKANKNHRYPKGTVFYEMDEKLRTFSKKDKGRGKNK
jgi:lon-related putative ATP-dependent protease